jgi:cyclohexanone monooxygenase
VDDTAGADQASSSEFDPVGLRQKYREERDKRLRPHGNAQYLDASGSPPLSRADPYLASSPCDPKVS